MNLARLGWKTLNENRPRVLRICRGSASAWSERLTLGIVLWALLAEVHMCTIDIIGRAHAPGPLFENLSSAYVLPLRCARKATFLDLTLLLS